MEDLVGEMTDFTPLCPWRLADEIAERQPEYPSTDDFFIVAIPLLRFIDTALEPRAGL